MLSVKIGKTLAEIREMSPVDYHTYFQVFDAENKLSRSIIKKAG